MYFGNYSLFFANKKTFLRFDRLESLLDLPKTTTLFKGVFDVW